MIFDVQLVYLVSVSKLVVVGRRLVYQLKVVNSHTHLVTTGSGRSIAFPYIHS